MLGIFHKYFDIFTKQKKHKLHAHLFYKGRQKILLDSINLFCFPKSYLWDREGKGFIFWDFSVCNSTHANARISCSTLLLTETEVTNLCLDCVVSVWRTGKTASQLAAVVSTSAGCKIWTWIHPTWGVTSQFQCSPYSTVVHH